MSIFGGNSAASSVRGQPGKTVFRLLFCPAAGNVCHCGQLAFDKGDEIAAADLIDATAQGKGRSGMSQFGGSCVGFAVPGQAVSEVVNLAKE